MRANVNRSSMNAFKGSRSTPEAARSSTRARQKVSCEIEKMMSRRLLVRLRSRKHQYQHECRGSFSREVADSSSGCSPQAGT